MTRRILLAADLHEQIVNPDKFAAERMAFLRADLDRFSTGGQVVVGNKKHKTCLMKQLEPEDDEIWEIRSREPKPSLRLLGAFAGTNCFLGFYLYDRQSLGDEHSKEWRDAIVATKAKWRQHLLTYERHKGPNIHDYISKDAVDARKLS